MENNFNPAEGFRHFTSPIDGKISIVARDVDSGVDICQYCMEPFSFPNGHKKNMTTEIYTSPEASVRQKVHSWCHANRGKQARSILNRVFGFKRGTGEKE